MAKTLQIAPDLYSRPPKTAIPGARWDFRSIAVTAAQVVVTVANNAIIALGILPIGHRLSSFFVETDALDSGTPTIVFDIGIVNSYYGQPAASATTPGFDTGTAPALVSSSVVLPDRTIVYGNILTGAVIAKTGGRVDTLALAASMNKVNVDNYHDRIIAINITTVASAGAQAGNMGIGYGIDID